MTADEFCCELRQARDKLEAELKEVQQRVHQFTADLQICCPHSMVYELPYNERVQRRPARVCVTCGLAEQGWNYYILPSLAITRPCEEVQFSKMQRGAIHHALYPDAEARNAAIRKACHV